MIRIHVDLLQNLQQAIFVINIPSNADCSIQSNRIVIKNEENHMENIIDFNDLIIDVNKGSEITSPEIKNNGFENQSITRTFKFPFLRLPKIVDSISYKFNDIKCVQCQSLVKILDDDNRTFKIIQQSNSNADDINEVIYCHRFCEAHQHEHPLQQRLHKPIDLHSELIILETTDCFIIGKEYLSSNLINNEFIQCQHCSTNLGLFNIQSNLISLNKCSLLPFSTDYLASSFRYHEPGRYIIKIPKGNESIFLIWILPNQILSSDISLDSSIQSSQMNFHRTRKILFTHVTSIEHRLFVEWKRDFSVNTLLVNQFCLEHLSKVFEYELNKFPHGFNSKETFQSLTISC